MGGGLVIWLMETPPPTTLLCSLSVVFVVLVVCVGWVEKEEQARKPTNKQTKQKGLLVAFAYSFFAFPCFFFFRFLSSLFFLSVFNARAR